MCGDAIRVLPNGSSLITRGRITGFASSIRESCRVWFLESGLRPIDFLVRALAEIEFLRTLFQWVILRPSFFPASISSEWRLTATNILNRRAKPHSCLRARCVTRQSYPEGIRRAAHVTVCVLSPSRVPFVEPRNTRSLRPAILLSSRTNEIDESYHAFRRRRRCSAVD